MSNVSSELIRVSGYSRDGFAERYDENRPSPPPVLLDVLCGHAQSERPVLVVDLGCGTGLSTRAWAGRAREVIGVEANAAMVKAARERTSEWTVRYVEGFSSDTGLPDECADIATCSQSFHWMEPDPTLAEVARILRPGGVFAAYDYDVPLVIHPDVDEAFGRYLSERRQARQKRRIEMGASRWPKEEHLARIDASGLFGYAREIVLHGTCAGGVDRVVGLAHSIGPYLGELDPQLDELHEVAERVLGDRVVGWLIGYRVRLAVK